MPNAANGLLKVEQGAVLVPFELMAHSGDRKTFTPTGLRFSGYAGKAAQIRPNGVVTGLNMVTAAASGSDDVVDIAAFSADSQGVRNLVSTTVDQAVSRPTVDNKKISSITMTSSGVIAVIAGTAGATFSEVRAAAGGPPELPVDSVELGQVRLSSATLAPILASEIFQVVGQHVERADQPVFAVDNIGLGLDATVAAQTNAHIKFTSELPLSHADGKPKRVYAQYYEPIMAEVSDSVDFTAVETSHSTSSTQVYQRTVGSTSESLGQGGFKALVNDGVNDILVRLKNQNLTFQFFPDMNKLANVVTQGKLGIKRSWPVANEIELTATISSAYASVDFSE